jgi:hypothetical protein
LRQLWSPQWYSCSYQAKQSIHPSNAKAEGEFDSTSKLAYIAQSYWLKLSEGRCSYDIKVGIQLGGIKRQREGDGRDMRRVTALTCLSKATQKMKPNMMHVGATYYGQGSGLSVPRQHREGELSLLTSDRLEILVSLILTMTSIHRAQTLISPFPLTAALILCQVPVSERQQSAARSSALSTQNAWIRRQQPDGMQKM